MYFQLPSTFTSNYTCVFFFSAMSIDGMGVRGLSGWLAGWSTVNSQSTRSVRQSVRPPA